MGPLLNVSEALLKACGSACASPMASTVMIPEGTYARCLVAEFFMAKEKLYGAEKAPVLHIATNFPL